jgi:DNA-binding XRE family transcriptional regulator
MIGRSVQIVKDNVSNDLQPSYWHYSNMAVWGREQEFNEAFIARVKRLREERGWTSEQMAKALGIPADRYRKYEYRTPLPHYLVEPFSIIVDRDVSYLLTGKAPVGVASPRVPRIVRTATGS